MKLSKDSYWLKSGTYTLLDKASFLLFGFGSVFFLLRTITKDDFGVWALFLTVTAFIEVARMGLIQNGFVKYLSAAEEHEHGKITTASFTLNIILTICSAIILSGIAHVLGRVWEAPRLEFMLYIYIATTFALIPFFQFNFVQQANFDFKGSFWANFVRQGTMFFYIVVSFFLKYDITLYKLVMVQVVAAVIGAFVSFLFGRKYIVIDKKIDWHWVKKLFHYGKYVFGTGLSTMVYKSIDKIMLGVMLTPAFVAIYEVALRITRMVEVPTTSMAAIVFPKSAQRSVTEGDQSTRYLYEKSVGTILGLILPGIAFVFLFTKQVVLIIAGDAYLDAVPILKLTLLYGIFMPFSIQFGTILDSIGRPKVNFYFVVFSAVLNVIFNYVFITKFGLVGAVYGTLTTISIKFVLNQIILYKLLKIKTYHVFYYTKDFYVYCYHLVAKRLKLKRPVNSIT